MKKIIVLVLIMVMASSVCFAGSACSTKSKAKDPITATAEVAGKTVAAPVEAVFGGKQAKSAKTGAKDVQQGVKK